jgi:hypothetical protein
MRYLKYAIAIGILGFGGCGLGRDDTPPPDVNLETEEITISMGSEFIPGDDSLFLELED